MQKQWWAVSSIVFNNQGYLRKWIESKLLEHTYGECLAQCSEVTKNEAMCPGFCDFVNHLYTHDGTIFDTFTNLYHQDDDVVVSIIYYYHH